MSPVDVMKEHPLAIAAGVLILVFFVVLSRQTSGGNATSQNDVGPVGAAENVALAQNSAAQNADANKTTVALATLQATLAGTRIAAESRFNTGLLGLVGNESATQASLQSAMINGSFAAQTAESNNRTALDIAKVAAQQNEFISAQSGSVSQAAIAGATQRASIAANAQTTIADQQGNAQNAQAGMSLAMLALMLV